MELREARARISMDPHYPRFHVAPPVGWMNDPHPIYFKGAYHIFYQYSYILDDPYGGPHRWGHAASNDLIHWKHFPVAIAPKEHGIREDRHIYSGCVVDNNGVGTAIYTIDNIDVWISTSADDNLTIWKKYQGNPVIKGPPPGLEIHGGMRDPWVWKEGNTWYMIIGSGLKGDKGPVLPLYRSTDLIHWQYLHPFYQGDARKGDGTFCECPSFFPLGDRHVLALSTASTYLVGRYRDQFIPESRGRLDYGRIYVPQFVLDGKGRRIMWAWVTESRDREAQRQAGWASMQTLPRVLSLQPDCTLHYRPAEELQALRRDHREFHDILLAADDSMILKDVQGAQLEIEVTFQPNGAKSFGLELGGASEQVEIAYDYEAKTLRCKEMTAPLELKQAEQLMLRVFFDGSVVEVYANERVCITERTYPSDPDAMKVRLFARGGQVTIGRIDVWKMGTIWSTHQED